MNEKLYRRAVALISFSVNSIIVLILTTINYKSRIPIMESYIEIFINPAYSFWANVIYTSLIFILVTFTIGVCTYRRYKSCKK